MASTRLYVAVTVADIMEGPEKRRSSGHIGSFPMNSFLSSTFLHPWDYPKLLAVEENNVFHPDPDLRLM